MKQIDPLILWYTRNQRNLPWRENRDPYRVWLSEIILQQTRVDQGIPYFYKLLSHYPHVQSLANSTEDELLTLWSGLGYYSRALNLLKTARIISNDFNGVFPASYSILLSLPGIGPYTAAAIASIAFDLPQPAIDGNAIRVYSRWNAIEGIPNTQNFKTSILNFASQFFNTFSPGTINQAIMELGATICTPISPNCSTCPLNQQCTAFQTGSTALFPQKAKKTKQKSRTLNYLILFNVDYTSVALVKRDHSDIWKGLLEPIPIPESQLKLFNLSEEPQTQYLKVDNKDTQPLYLTTITHILSHQRITANFFITSESPSYISSHPITFYSLEQIDKLPLPALFVKLFNNLPKHQYFSG
ncbi:MAG: A/G-specific adenine glycosylase [Sphingobacteriia bacterium]|nr:A/G-specific adenine glycosylase [Sphingobacteriia bacterium]